MEKDPHAEGIKKSIEDIIGADTSLRRKKKTDEDFQKEKFTKLIQTLDEIEVWAAHLAYSQFSEAEMMDGTAWRILNDHA